MFRRVVLRIEFPKKEFQMIPSIFTDNFSLRYRVGGSFFYLGEVISSYWQRPNKVVMTLEVRKDETPVWYLRRIIQSAQQEEILLMKNSEVVCKGGRLVETRNLEKALDSQMVEPLEAWIMAKRD